MLVRNACVLIAAAAFVTEVPEPFRSRLASTNETSGAFVQTKTTADGRKFVTKGEYRIEEFSIDRPSFTRLTGISVIWYNDQLLMFGGVDEKMNYFGREILISNDEGLNWTKADSTKNQLPEVYSARQKQTAIVRDNYIYLFGGQDANISYSDVYRGRLNSIDWNNN